MNDGDPNSPRRGRAQVPGSSGGARTGGSANGGAAGRARVGRAPVSGAGAGRASVGRAGVPAADAKAGRAKVPAGASGRATVGRASVGSGSPKSGSKGADVLENRGPAQRPPKSKQLSAAAAARARRARRRNWILGAFALLIMIAGGTVVGGAFFYDTVALPQDLPQRDQATTVFFSDNKTQMAKIGNQNRTIIPSDQIPRDVKNAVVATENKDFYSDQGISYTGILRAAWNNFTGGERQGASTITQQYARDIADLKGITYSRKLREAVLAMKLNKTYSKDQILTAYLNSVYFGRESYGIEAAAEAYFGKHAKELNVAEGMALAAMIRNPAGGPNGLSYYDGSANPGPALDRFNNYIKPNMLQMKFITPEQAATLKYPEMKKYDPTDPAFQAQWGLDKPTGNVLHNVMDELYHMKDPKGNQMFPDLKSGGYRIVTTIDYGMQQAAEKYADITNKESPLYGKQTNAVASLVSVEPYSGRVKAYYGGPNGGDKDLAGVWRDPVLTKCGPDEPKCDLDRLQGYGRHFPASSFKIYTLGAALRDGVSINSYWDGKSGKKFPGRPTPVVNAEGNTNCAGGDQHCTLVEATAESLNVPFYSLTKTIGANKVLDFAKDAGIRYIWNLDNGSQRWDLSTQTPTFSPELGIGQYPITVLDHANGVATIAARGARAPVHFVSKVYKGASTVYSEPFKPTQIPGYTQAMADDESFALQKVLDHGTGNGLKLAGRAAAAKTGTWQAAESSTDTKNNGNSNAWMVGYIAPDLSKKPQFYGLATAVWVGAKEGDSKAVKINGAPLFGSTGPGPIWKKYMDAATASMPKTKFPDQKGTGDVNRGDSTPPAASPPADPNAGQPGGVPCLIPQLQNCQPGGQPGQQPGQPTTQGGQPGNGNGNGGQGGGSPVPDSPVVLPTRRP